MKGKLITSIITSFCILVVPTVSHASTLSSSKPLSHVPSTKVTKPVSTAPMINNPSATTSTGTIVPLNSVTGNGGTATLNEMDSAQSFSWSLKPTFIGPWEYNLTITAYIYWDHQYHDTGSYSWSGASANGSVSGVVPYSKLGLPSGNYWCEMSGTYYFDFGSGTVDNPSTNIVVR